MPRSLPLHLNQGWEEERTTVAWDMRKGRYWGGGIRRTTSTVGHQSPGCSRSTDFRAFARWCSMALPSSLQRASIAARNVLARIPYGPLSGITTFLHSQRLEVCRQSDWGQWCKGTWENNRESVSCQNVALWPRGARTGVQVVLGHARHCLRGAMRIQAVLCPLALQWLRLM